MSKESIIQKRIGGLGSSDAKMVERIARNGILSESDRQRIAIMLGLEERQSFTTIGMQYGDFIEKQVYDSILTKYPTAILNPYYKSEKLSKQFGFDVFNHIDFEIETDKEIIWIENKATKYSYEKLLDTYSSQLRWHAMLLHEKAQMLNKNSKLFISYYKVDSIEDFNPEKLSLIKFETNQNAVNAIKQGLKIISEEIKDFSYENKEELYAANLPAKVQDALDTIISLYNTKSEAEKQIDYFTSGIGELMDANNIKSIKHDKISITRVAESSSMQFDKKEFEIRHPKLAKKFLKTVYRKPYVKISINKL